MRHQTTVSHHYCQVEGKKTLCQVSGSLEQSIFEQSKSYGMIFGQSPSKDITILNSVSLFFIEKTNSGMVVQINCVAFKKNAPLNAIKDTFTEATFDIYVNATYPSIIPERFEGGSAAKGDVFHQQMRYRGPSKPNNVMKTYSYGILSLL